VLAMPPQLVSMYLIFCVIANWLSILAPLPVAAGAMRLGQARGMAILFNMLFIFLFPLALVPTLVPLGIEFAFHGTGTLENVPICLVLTLLQCVAIVLIYRLVLNWQGQLLQAREQRVLELVAVKAE
jgi:ABC-2 type transport system permease protein